MVNVIEKKHLEYSVDTTFNLPVYPTADGEFSESTQLRFIVSKNENDEPVIDKTFNINSDLTFWVTLTEYEKNKLELGEYIYKMQTIKNGVISTEISGYFIVKWGR